MTTTAEGACAVIEPREPENIGQNRWRNTAENRAGKMLLTTRSSEMDSTPEAEASGPSELRFSQLDHCSQKLWA